LRFFGIIFNGIYRFYEMMKDENFGRYFRFRISNTHIYLFLVI